MISIIIPIYNTEQYLKRCIDSILESGYKNYEIILVNDGSTDHSARICRKYCERNRQISFIDRKHEGVSAARNAGIRASRGEWLVFVDSDDRISEDFLEIIGKEEHQNQDLLLFDFDSQTEKKQEGKALPVRFYKKSDRVKLINRLLEAEQLVKGGSTSLLSPCAKAYKKAVIDQYSIQFFPDISAGEDRLFNIEFLLKIRSCAYIPEAVYHVEPRPDSVMRGFNPDCLQNDLRYQRRLREILAGSGILPLVNKAYYNSVLSGMADVLIRGIFNPHSTRNYRQNRRLCRRMHKSKVYKRALRYNGKTGVLPRRILLWAWGREYFGAAALISKLSYRILEKFNRL